MTATKLPLLLALLTTLSLISSASAAIPAHLHPKRHLFENPHKAATGVKRQSTSTRDYPSPNGVPATSLLPRAWTDALNEAVSDGRIPNIPQSTVTSNGNIVYPHGSSERAIGSWTNSKTIGPNDISDAPHGVWGVNFDDGPTNESPTLYRYLESQNQSATHFLIGANIVTWTDAFEELAEGDQQLAVHTWSHTLQTSLSNEQVLGELAWTMQVIYDRTGKIPNLWRPPQGDVDNRVRAIAEEVLGMQCVLWQADSNDWCLDVNFQSTCPAGNTIGQSYDSILAYIRSHVSGDKSQGVILLEHEVRAPSFALFEEYYPTLRENGWTPEPIGNFDQAQAWYANGVNASTPTSGQTGVLSADQVSMTSTSSSSSSSTSVATSTDDSNTSSQSGSSPSSTASSGQQNEPTDDVSGALTSIVPKQALCIAASLAAMIMTLGLIL